MQNRGYTIPELFVVILVVGIFSVIAINKASYAFVDTNQIDSETETMILIKSARAYGNSIIEILKQEEKYITGKDLVEAEYLVDDNYRFSNTKIKLSFDSITNNVNVEILG